jgi:glycosyltransferase involved in cell wall biosynthesis
MRASFRERVPGLGDRPYFLFLSRVHPKKGVDLLIRAYATQLAQRTLAGIATPDLVIAGPLDSNYADSMRALAQRELAQLPKAHDHVDPPGIHFPGMLSGDSKWGAFYGCEAFILPSHQENFGIAVVEALACGRPVLISDQVNISDEIEQSGAGFADRDEDAGTAALMERFFALDDAAKATMSARALECYTANFSPETAAFRLLEAISPEGPQPDERSESP